jgi:hypothetical protein
MYTTTVLVALHLFAVPSPAPTWHRDYDSAMKRAEELKKPVAVFVASGKHPWTALCKDGEPGPEVRRLLTEHYICVYVDASRPAEQPLARSFEAGEQPLLVLSSHNRLYQAYRHSGTVASASLAQALQRHATEETVAVQAEPAPCRT